MKTEPYLIVVKGECREALEAVIAHGAAPEDVVLRGYVGKFRETYLVWKRAVPLVLVGWCCEACSAPFPAGALLHYGPAR